MAMSCLLLSACAATGREIEIVDAGCFWITPIYISQQDQITDDTARAILTHNTMFASRCRE